MNRSLTNTIRFFMDECLPPIIRDSKWFMYPFYYLAYRGKNIKAAMNFKKEVYDYTPEQYENFYKNINSISRNRITDLNRGSIDLILQSIPSDTKNLIDVGCGNGFLLKQVRKKHPSVELTGADIKKISDASEYNFVYSRIEKIPFENKSFDVVSCCHTIEHILNPSYAIEELKRITKGLLIIVVPCQRYYFYTLDEHVNFYPTKETLTSLIGLKNYTCKKVDGDWVYIGQID
jgi:ubiquinone/menaquinone biosynthesis C-methylase UbiE